jgi:hypothetical protein
MTDTKIAQIIHKRLLAERKQLIEELLKRYIETTKETV